MGNDRSVVFLGARGSVPTDSPTLARYGGATACILLRLGGAVIVLDGGTGLMGLSKRLEQQERHIHLLLSHPHFDHLAGIPVCPLFYDPAVSIQLYAESRLGLSPRQQLLRLMSAPLWPVGPEAFSAQVSYHAVAGAFALGAVSVRTMEGSHPGGCTIFRLEHQECSVVYATDYELDEESTPRLAAFAKDCSLLLCDGQYAPEEAAAHKGFGHSTWRQAGQLAAVCGAKMLRVLHHAPLRTDAELDACTPLLRKEFSNSAFAQYGEEIVL